MATSIEWKRGFLRLWLVSFLAWVVFAGFASGVPELIENIPIGFRYYVVGCNGHVDWNCIAGEDERERWLHWLKGSANQFAELVVGFLLASLICWLVIVWVSRGFRPGQN